MEGSNYDSTRSSRRIGQPYNDETTNEYDYNSSKRYEPRSGGGGDDGWGTTPSYAKDSEWNEHDDRTKSSDKSHSSRVGGAGQKWNSYEGNNRDRGADRFSYSKGGGAADKYDDGRASYSGDRTDKYYGSTGDSGNNRSYRDNKQQYDYPDDYDWGGGDRYNYPTDSSKKTGYPDSQDWSRGDNKTYPKHDSRAQYSEGEGSRRYEYSNSSNSRGHSDRSYAPPENDYEQYYNSKSRYEESPYPRNDDWDRKASYPRNNNDDLKRTSAYDSNIRGSGGSGYGNDNNDRKRPRTYPDDNNNNNRGGQRYPPSNRGYRGSTTTSSSRSNDYKRLKSYDDNRASSGRYDEGPKDYNKQPVGNESSSEIAEEPMWEEDRYGTKVHPHSNTENDDSNDPWGVPPSSSDPGHWDNSYWDNSWGPKPGDGK